MNTPTTQLLGIKEFRTNLSTLWKRARKNNIRYILMYHAKPVLEVRPLHEEDVILEKLIADTRNARGQIKKGRTFTSDAVCRKLGL